MTGKRIGGAARTGGTLVLAAVLLSMLLAACGGGNSSTSSEASTASSGGSESSGSEPGGSSAAEAGLERAKAIVAPLLKQPKTIGPIEPLPEISKQSELLYIQCGVPVCTEHREGFEEAAKALGLPYKVLHAGLSPQEQTKAWDQAVTESPAAVSEQGFALELFTTQLAELKAKGIPVISAGDTIGNDYNGAVVSDIQPPSSFTLIGERYGQFVVAESEGKANAVFVTAPEIPLLEIIKKGFDNAFKENCPECKVAEEDVTPAEIGKGLPSEIVSYLQTHPETEWVTFGSGDEMAGVPQAVKAAGIEGVKFTSGAGGPLNWSYIEEGAQTMDLAANPKILSFFLVERMVRTLAGEILGDKPVTIPQQYVTKQTIEEFKPEFDLEGEGWTVAGFQQEFEKGWGWK